MEQVAYKVLIPTSGTGSRLGELTRSTNKSLVKVGDKTAISYIVEKYPIEIPIVVTLGYLGQSVKDFLEKNYPDRVFEFVWVDIYEGLGSSLGYSMLKAKEQLQCPFVFHACDTIVQEDIPAPNHNWIGGYVEDWETSILPLEHYRTHAMQNKKILYFNERGILPFDSIHIGLDGIFDYHAYWQILQSLYDANPNDQQISDVPVLDEMIQQGILFNWVPYRIWLDIGNREAFNRAQGILLPNAV